MARSEDDADLRRLNAILDRLAVAEVEAVVSDALAETRRRAGHEVRRILLDELTRRASAAPSSTEAPAPPASPPAAPAPTEPRPGWYVYAVVAPDGQGVFVEGIEAGRSVEIVSEAGISAAVSRVDASALADLGSDPEALADVARRHDDVVADLAARWPTVPLRFGTVCASQDDVRRLLTSEHHRFREVLDAVRDRDEFGVQVVAEPIDEGADGAPDGAGYLRALSDRRRAREARTRMAEEMAGSVHAHLDPLAVTWRDVPTRRPDVVSNLSYLVDRAAAETFRAQADELDQGSAAEGVRVRLTGPWPPYSFTDFGERTYDARTGR